MRLVKRILKILIVLALCVAIVNYIFFVRIPDGGELIEKSTSPKGEYTLNVYVHESSLSADALRCEVLNHENGRSKNIYWNYPKSTAEIRWISDDTVDIDGIILNVKKDKYDFRWD